MVTVRSTKYILHVATSAHLLRGSGVDVAVPRVFARRPRRRRLAQMPRARLRRPLHLCRGRAGRVSRGSRRRRRGRERHVFQASAPAPARRCLATAATFTTHIIGAPPLSRTLHFPGVRDGTHASACLTHAGGVLHPTLGNRGRATRSRSSYTLGRHPPPPREAVPERRRRLFVLGEDERVLEAALGLHRDVLQFPDAVPSQLRPLF